MFAELGSEHRVYPQKHAGTLMQFISTTATAVENLKREAKALSKTPGVTLTAAREVVAKKHGYLHWKHVTVCHTQTGTRPRAMALPQSLKDLLARVKERYPAVSDSQEAFARGFVFAMDVKDAQEFAPGAAYAECSDGWYLAAKDLWPGLVHSRDGAGSTFAASQSPEDLARTAMDHVQNYRLFRHLGPTIPASPAEALQWVGVLTSYAPTHIWIGGKFTDFGGGFQTQGAGAQPATPGAAVHPSKKRTRFEKFGHLLNDKERELFKGMSAQDQDFWLFQLAKKTPLGQARYKPVDVSITVPWGATESAQP
jgi:hypothetical protein